MKKIRERKLSLLVIIAVMILMVAGCGSKNNEDKQTSSNAVQESQETSGEHNQGTDNEEGQESSFDFSQAFDNVEVNGKKVPFPFTLNDLGEDFSVDSIVEMENGICGVTLYYKGKKIADVYMKINSKEDFDKETKIYELYSSDYNTQMIKINGLDCNTSSNEVKNIFKGFKEYVDENGMLTKIEERSGENYFLVSFDENGNVDAIYMGKGE